MNKGLIAKRIKDNLRTTIIGREIFHSIEVTSTNDLAKEMAVEGADEGTIIISETQIRGRGRLGRKWLSPRGGIWFSVILRPEISTGEIQKLTFVAALAVAKTVIKNLKLEAQIKWPNDVLVNNKKVCGILTEVKSSNDVIDFVIVGIGINANVDVKRFPENLKMSITSLKEEMKKEISREKLLLALLEELEYYYKAFKQHKFDLILEEWKSLTNTLNAYVEVSRLDKKVQGLAVDVDQDGALLIKLEDGNIIRIISGDVHIQC